ncbi:MAG: DegV family protein [Anaerolineae bacterium]
MNQSITPTVVTGSAAQVPSDLASQLGIEILPLEIYVNGKEYLDGIDITPSDLYQKMRNENVNVKTAAPSVGQYFECFKTILEQGEREILCITLSNKLSSDYVSAVSAANMAQEELQTAKVTVFDSFAATAPQGFLAIEAAHRLHRGESMETVVSYLSTARQRTGFLAALDTLSYLSQGGRIGKAASLVGNALQIKPILTLKDGIVAPETIVRTEDRIMSRITSIVKQKTEGRQKLRLSVMHADALKRAKRLRKMLLELDPSIEIPILEFTPVMGAHAGPGLVGVGYYYE